MAGEPTGDGAAGGPDPTGSLNEPAPVRSLPARVRAVYGRQVGVAEKALMVSWAAFGTTFGTARATTHLLRWRDGGSGGSGGIVIAGRHVHHFNFGIALLAAVGGVAVHGQEPARRHPLTAAAYGAGAALILDELALLLDLQDVYWAKDGRTSVDAAFGALAVGGLYFASIPFWHGAAREIARTRPST